jgi:putative membrane protein
MSNDAISLERFKVMERKLFYGIMTPGGLITLITGIWLWLGWGFMGAWIHIKVALVFVLIIYHVWCGVILIQFKNDTNKKSHIWFRWFNEFPVVILVAVVFLVVLKP